MNLDSQAYFGCLRIVHMSTDWALTVAIALIIACSNAATPLTSNVSAFAMEDITAPYMEANATHVSLQMVCGVRIRGEARAGTTEVGPIDPTHCVYDRSRTIWLSYSLYPVQVCLEPIDRGARY